MVALERLERAIRAALDWVVGWREFLEQRQAQADRADEVVVQQGSTRSSDLRSVVAHGIAKLLEHCEVHGAAYDRSEVEMTKVNGVGQNDKGWDDFHREVMHKFESSYRDLMNWYLGLSRGACKVVEDLHTVTYEESWKMEDVDLFWNHIYLRVGNEPWRSISSIDRLSSCMDTRLDLEDGLPPMEMPGYPPLPKAPPRPAVDHRDPVAVMKPGTPGSKVVS